MSHTPAPWLISWSDDGDRLVYELDKPSGRYYTEEEGAANARLIAAAPDLLAACQSVLDWFNDLKTMQHQQLVEGQTLESASKNWETMWDTPLDHPLDLQALMDAVAKAEGR